MFLDFFVFLAVGKWSPSVKDAGADLVPPLDLCIRTRYRNFCHILIEF